MPLSPPASSAALSAFLRGIERRAQVFALAQCGSGTLARDAVADTVHRFGAEAGTTPVAQWPVRFWSLLVQQPGLVGAGAGDPVLAALSPGPRAALLLRLVAGLDFGHGAQVLAVSEPAYRFALQRGLDQLHAAGHDMATLEGLRDALRQRLAGTESDAEPEPPDPAPRSVATGPGSEHDGDSDSDGDAALPRWLWLLPAVALIAFGASFLPPVERRLQAWFGPAPVATPALPPITLDQASALVTHPDFDLLRSPADEALARDVAFLSWIEAGAPDPGQPVAPLRPARALPSPSPAGDFAGLPPEVRVVLQPIAALWPQLDTPERSRLLANARAWVAMADGEREALRQRAAAWDGQPPAQRAARRGQHGRWQRLSDAEREALRAAAAANASLPAPEQLQLRDRFSAMPTDLQDAWSLGPQLGRALPPLAPLFEFVPADERDALLAVVQVLSPGRRDLLAARVAAMPARERERLRRQLIAAPPERLDALVAGEAEAQ